MNQISWNDFEKVELRVGTIVDVQDFPETRKPAYKVTLSLPKLHIDAADVGGDHGFTSEESKCLLVKKILAFN